MDGYSVQEAASVLGVAEGRVWELLARGVLLGTPEGDSMRVFLKAQPGPIATAGSREEPSRTNGNGGSHEGEGSAFRELLTEFRNLTERYGQALLALGEARGEVAGLRSRVDQLEARFDLRLPPSVEPAPVAWESTTIAANPQVAPQREPSAMPLRTAVPPPPARRTTRPRKARSAREATAGFADALARALDPRAPDLGPTPAEAEDTATTPAMPEPVQGAAEPMAEPAELMAEPAIQPDATMAAALEVPEPIEIEDAAEQEPAESEAPTYSAVVVEPDWFADGDFAWLDAADHEPPPATQPIVAGPPEMEPEPTDESVAPSSEESAEDLSQMAQEGPQAVEELEAAAAEPSMAAEPVTPAEPFVEEHELPLPPLPDPVPVAVLEAEAPYEPWQSPEPPTTDAPAGDALADTGEAPPSPDRSTAEGPETMVGGSAIALEDLEEEVMWLGADPAAVVQDERRPAIVAEAEPWPAVDAAPTLTEATRPPLAMTEDELARLALDEGWDEAEVAAIRAMITPLPSSTVDLPGAAELHEAMAALEAVPVRVDPGYRASRQWAKPTAQDDDPPRQDEWAFEAEPAPPPQDAPRPATDVTSALRQSVTDPGWLRRRQGPAAAAYRRLRRLLPG